MPRGPLSVILRGSKLLAAKQVVKSAIVILCGGSHLSWIQDPDVIRVHPLFRALCLGANTSVVDPANYHWYSGNYYHSFTSVRCMHRPPQPPAPLALHSTHSLRRLRFHQHASVTQNSTLRILIKFYIRKDSGHITPVRGQIQIRNLRKISRLAATGEKRHRSEARREKISTTHIS